MPGISFQYIDYGAVLKANMDARGLVDYRDLKAHREKLDGFADSLSKLDPLVYDTWNDREKIAFWINAYNALTLNAIIDHYPIRATFFKSLRYPSKSIRQIPGFWNELSFTVMGRTITLDGIEHETLRAKFNEPRIHMALVCAALGCPILRNEPYLPEKLDSQLNDQARQFLSNPEKFRIDKNEKVVHLSTMFKWFAKDFEKNYGKTDKFTRFQETERAVLNFISGYLDPADRPYLETGVPSIDYLRYDWSLNDRNP